jgi:hypothetical protein
VIVVGTAAAAADAIKSALAAVADEAIKRRIKFLLIQSSRFPPPPIRRWTGVFAFRLGVPRTRR